MGNTQTSSHITPAETVDKISRIMPMRKITKSMHNINAQEFMQ